MMNSNLPKGSILTGRTALAFYGYIKSDDNLIDITMKSGTNTSSYKDKYNVFIQRESTLSIGVINEFAFKVYSKERLFIELDLFNLGDSFKEVNNKLIKDINFSVLKDIREKLRSKRRGIDWKRIDHVLNLYLGENELTSLLNRMSKEIIFETSIVEIPTLTFIDTEKVINDLPTNNLIPSQVDVIRSLKNALEELIANNEPFSFNYFKNLNYLIARGEEVKAGQLRYSNVRIGGTEYVPPIPSESLFNNLIKEISSIDNIPLMISIFIAKVAKLQFFYDGNKRTAIISGNKLLIDKQYGLISIPVRYRSVYLKLLKEYYENEEKLQNLIAFLQLCIFRSQEDQIVQHKKLDKWVVDNNLL